MSRYTADDFTDDEDSSQPEDENPSSELIDESIAESSYENSERDSDEGNKSKSFNTTDAIHRTLNDSRVANDVISDSDDSEPVDSQTPNKGKMKNTKPKTKRNVILSDSDSEVEDEAHITEEDSTSEELSLHSIVDSDTEVDKLTEQLNSSKISNDFDFKRNGNILNSTVLDPETSSTTPKVSSKRSLNKSVDTPRILKQMKESLTPKNVPSARNFVTPKVLNQGPDPLLTPRNVEEIISRSPSPSLEVLSGNEDDDVIEVSSDEREIPVIVVPPRLPKKYSKQTTLDSLVKKTLSSSQNMVKQETKAFNVLEVSPRELEEQKVKVKKLEADVHILKSTLKTVNLANLPDNGKLLMERHTTFERMLRDETEKLSKMKVSKENSPPKVADQNKIALTWEEIEANAAAVQPKTFGKRAMTTYDAQKALTMDRLQQLHGSIKNCPTEDTLAEDPKGLKVELMPHQKRALAWLMWREHQKPPGGILADDMGLGKTLTMISLMLKTNEGGEDEQSDEENQSKGTSQKFNGGTLVVCPASLINQWSGELERRTKRGLASYEVYHGPKRETKPKMLAQHDMVITTYSIIMNECERQGAVFRVKWRRIVLDEAHQIRNYKSQTSIAVCQLAAKSRWALTGTPVHNKEQDMYALLKFLRCTPFDDIQVWRRWVGDKSTGGQERLHTVISSIMLRRTKAELIEKGALNYMPERKLELIEVQLNKNEMNVYQKILIFSRTLFAQFLHQRAEKNQDEVDRRYLNMPDQQEPSPNQEYFKMRQKLLHMNKVKDIKQHEILVLLLRLRQICCHPSLITGMLNEDADILGDEDGESPELNLLDQLNNLSLGDDDVHKSRQSLGEHLAADAPGLKEAAKGFLNPSNPVFSKERVSSKIKVMLGVLKEKVLEKQDKAIIVSQWPGFLRLIGYHLKQEGIVFDQLDGSVPVNKRMAMVDKFNDPKDTMKILLLSLTAGGVGLNLVGANHLFLLDLHWNPQLESQAQDRIYRVGQEKPVFVYKFLATDTIEKRILDLQEKKLDIANSMLTGSKQAIGSQLSLQDLKMLFDMQ